MFRLLLCLLLCYPSTALALIDYQLDISLQPEQHQLSATATITFEGTVDSVALDLDQACSVTSIHQAGKKLTFRFADGRLSFHAQPAMPVVISYTGRFNDDLGQMPIHNEDPSYGINASITTSGTYLSSGIAWYPRPASEQVHYRVSVHAPRDMIAVTSGRRLLQKRSAEQSQSTWEIDYPMSGLTLSAGNYQVFEDLTGPVPIYAYFYPSSAPLATTYLQQARLDLERYVKLFGPYPFHKFAIVENFFPTGYGLPSWTLLGSSVISLPFIVKTSLGHEIAHSWWGNGVRVDYAQGNWCEGLTTYVADYLEQERISPAAALAYRQKILRDYASLVNQDNSFPISEFVSRRDGASQAIGYGKTAMLFHMLRRKVGEEKFWAGLREISRRFRYTRIGWDSFAKVFSNLNGRDLRPFFQQWLTSAIGPTLMLENVQRQKTPTGWMVSGQLTQQPPYYKLQVVLQLVTEHGKRNETQELDAASRPFQMHSNTRPTALIADPDADLFRILAPEEIPSTVNSIRGSDKLLVLRAEQNTPPEPARQMLLAALRKTDLPLQSLAQLPRADLETHDLLIFGTEEKLLPKEIMAQAASEQLHFPEQTAPLLGHSAFVVSRNPFNDGHHAAWFISRDPAQAETVARKIPHYGKYSYLLFKGATNISKGIRETGKSPCRVDFP